MELPWKIGMLLCLALAELQHHHYEKSSTIFYRVSALAKTKKIQGFLEVTLAHSGTIPCMLVVSDFAYILFLIIMSNGLHENLGFEKTKPCQLPLFLFGIELSPCQNKTSLKFKAYGEGLK